MTELQQASETLADILRRHANVNAFTSDWVEVLRRELLDPRCPNKLDLFRRGLADAILRSSISPGEYERITGEDFDTQEELNEWLTQMWRSVFGEAPIRLE